jgi:hypothetical protein
MNYRILIDHQSRLIQYSHVGIINLEDIGSAWAEFKELKEFTALKYNLLTDYSEAKFDMKLDDLDKITDHLVSQRDILNNKKQAIILSEPLSTALSMLFKGKIIKQIGFNVEIFSTKEGALKWLEQ